MLNRKIDQEIKVRDPFYVKPFKMKKKNFIAVWFRKIKMKPNFSSKKY